MFFGLVFQRNQVCPGVCFGICPGLILLIKKFFVNRGVIVPCNHHFWLILIWICIFLLGMPLDGWLLGWRRFRLKNLRKELLRIERAKVLLHDFLYRIDVLLLFFDC